VGSAGASLSAAVARRALGLPSSEGLRCCSMSSSGNDLLFEAANRKAAAFLAVRLGATADITLECRPHAGCENRQVGQVVVDKQGQR
jgi:hypothetical protein